MANSISVWRCRGSALIEAVMLAALGFLVATVLWLIMLPAISRRADRLARRRAELTFPLSVEEIAAERDHVRAEFAVKLREQERRSEESQAAKAAALAAAGLLDIQISELKTTVGVRDVTIADLDMTLKDTRATLASTEEQLAAEQGGHAATRADLAIRGQALSDREKELGEIRIERADLAAALAERGRERDAAAARGDRLEADLARTSAELSDLQGRHAALDQEKNGLRIALAGSETQGMALGAKLADTEARLAEKATSLAEGRADLAQVRAEAERLGREVAALAAERDRLQNRLRASEDRAAQLDQDLRDARSARVTVESKLAAARKEAETLSGLVREAHAEQARQDNAFASARRERDARIATLTADLDTARQAATTVRAERAELKEELNRLRLQAERATQRLDQETAQLRAEIVRVADQFLTLRSVEPAAKAPVEPIRPPMPALEPGPATRPQQSLPAAVPAAGRRAASSQRARLRKETAPSMVPDRAAE